MKPITTNKKNDRLKLLAEAPVGKLLWKYSLPSIVGMVIISLYNIIDRIFIGQWVGTEAIAGLVVSFPMMNISTGLSTLIGVGAAARISLMLGADDRQGAFRTLGNALILQLIVSFTYVPLFLLFLDPVIKLFGASADSLPYAKEFLTYMLPGLIIMNVALGLNSCMRSSGYPMRAMVTNFIGAGMNIILDPIFINVLHMGIKGAAIATSISMIFSGCFVFAHFIDNRSTVHFKRGIYKLDRKIVVGIVAIGASPALINLAASGVNAVINNTLMKYGGDLGVAALGIFSSLAALGVMTMTGISLGMQPIVGYNYGAHRFDRMRRAFWLAVCAATGVSVLCFIVGVLFPGAWARFFTTSDELIETTVYASRIGFLAFWTVGFQVIATTFFESTGKAGKSIFLSLSRQVIFLIPLLLLFSNVWHLDGVFYAFPVSDICSLTCCFLMIMWQLKQFKKIEANSLPFNPEAL